MPVGAAHVAADGVSVPGMVPLVTSKGTTRQSMVAVLKSMAESEPWAHVGSL